jgi:hypothetical protein
MNAIMRDRAVYTDMLDLITGDSQMPDFRVRWFHAQGSVSSHRPLRG